MSKAISDSYGKPQKFHTAVRDASAISLVVLSSLFFSGVPPISKIALFFLVFLVFIFSFKSPNSPSKTPSSFFLLLLLYLFFNAYAISQVVFDSKAALINFCLYFLIFIAFSSIQPVDLKRILPISFFIVLGFSAFLYLYSGYELINFYFYNQNILSSYALMSFIFSATILTSDNEKRYIKNICLINFLLSLSIIISLKSFAAFFLAAMGVIIIFKNKIKLKVSPLLAGIIGSALLLIVILFKKTDSFLDRIVWMTSGMNIWINNFVFGTGLDTFRFFYSEFAAKTIEPTTATLFVHNFFIHIASEIGFAGVLLFCSLLYFSIKPAFNFKNGKIFSSETALFLMPAIAILLLNFFDYTLIIPQISVLFYILLSSISTFHRNGVFLNKRVVFFLFIIFFTYGITSAFMLAEIDTLLKKPMRSNLSAAVKIDKTCWKAWKQLADLSLRNKEFSDAENYLNTAIKYNPRDVESHIKIASLLKIKSEKARALSHIKRAMHLNAKYTNKMLSGKYSISFK